VTDKLNRKLDQLAEAWNEAEIERPSLGRWIDQFDAGDQAIALRLLDCMQVHGWARLIRECRLLHQRICTDLKQDGFDTERCSDIDFSRAFVCKSGDLISYVYLKANRLPVTCFHNIEALHQGPPAGPQRSALVILDDTIGTGSQFLFTFVDRNAANRALLRRYARMRLAAIVAHDDVRQKWKLLQRHDVEQVMAIEERQLTCVFSRHRAPHLDAGRARGVAPLFAGSTAGQRSRHHRIFAGSPRVLLWSPQRPGAVAAAAVQTDRGFQRLPTRVTGGTAS
jgi:hypothetical protein